MESDDSAGSQMSPIERQSLGGQQVQRNRIARKGIDDEHVKSLWRLRGERSACVALHDGYTRARIANVGKNVARDWCDRRVDLVELDLISWTSIRGDRPCPQADHADIPRASAAAIADGEADAGIL